jgi:hypothetical protein
VIFLSFDSQDRNWVALLVRALRESNPDTEIFWTGEPLPSGLGWFQFIERNIQNCSGFLGVITNNASGTNNWINFEAGAAVGRDIGRMFLFASGIAIPADLSGAFTHVQLVGWSDRAAIRAGLERVGLNYSDEAVEVVSRVFTPFLSRTLPTELMERTISLRLSNARRSTKSWRIGSKLSSGTN